MESILVFYTVLTQSLCVLAFVTLLVVIVSIAGEDK